jgi:hypothetical protein
MHKTLGQCSLSSLIIEGLLNCFYRRFLMYAPPPSSLFSPLMLSAPVSAYLRL